MTSPSVVSTLIFFLHALRFAAGQFRTVPAPPPPLDPNYGGAVPRFTPIMGIVMVVLVVVFFLMGFCSVYIRRCARRRFRSRFDFDPNLNFRLGRAASAPTAGLDAAVVESFPTFVYSDVKGLKIGEASLECAVCLNEFEDDETLRLIPNCSHVFHPVCIDSWLSSHSTCPVCRSYLVPKPGDPSKLPPRVWFANLDAEPQTASDHIHTCTDEPVPVQQETERSNIIESPDGSNRRPPHWTKSNRWRITDLFPRSHSTGHSLVQPGDDIERFTLRLPEEVRNELLNSTLNRTRSCVVFPRAMCTKRSYRFDPYHRLDRPGCFLASPMFFGTGSVRSLKRESDNESASSNGARKELFKSVRWPLDRLKQSGRGNESVGETSSDRFRPDSEV